MKLTGFLLSCIQSVDNFMNVQRNLFAALLIFLVFLLTPQYLKLIGLDSETAEQEVPSNEFVDESIINITEPPPSKVADEIDLNINEKTITIINQYYEITLSSVGGGSIIKYVLSGQDDFDEYNYLGTFDETGVYNDNNPVVLSHTTMNSGCSPCLSINNGAYQFRDNFILGNYNDMDTIYLKGSKNIVLDYQYILDSGDYIIKSMEFFADSYEINSSFEYNLKESFPHSNVEIYWDSGIAPTELNSYDEATYSGAYVYQNNDIDYIVQSGENELSPERFNLPTDWIAIRNKFFTMAIIPTIKADYAILESRNLYFNPSPISNKTILSAPIYSATIGFRGSVGSLGYTNYIGPLDVDYINDVDSNLQAIMNFGWSIIAPFSKIILWFVKILNNFLNINYGVILIIIAIIMRVITGPLTRKSYESSAKMKLVAPMQKKIQEKYKSDPKKLQEEMGKLWKEHGVNPISGCLPMLLQWPILMSFFIVFRSTIEFRGEPFVLWIQDLSQPDYLFSLPFHIPLYGDGVAILPILMGISMFLTMRITMASDGDNTQKTMMYFMNAFFVIIFNQFPSGLTLYYTVYNFLAYQQQLSIKNSKK